MELITKIHVVDLENKAKPVPQVFENLLMLSDVERKQLGLFNKRMRKIGDSLEKHKVFIEIDAEETYIQDIINSVVEQMQDKYNLPAQKPMVWNTIQSYLKNSVARTKFEIERAKYQGMPVGLKLVRGAYMDLERKIASDNGRQDPINPTIEESARCYNENARYFLKNKSTKSELVLATHNAESTMRTQDQIAAEPALKPTVTFA